MGKRMGAWFALACVLGSSCGGSPRTHEQLLASEVVIVAIAPEDLSDADLGAPVDADFRRIPGATPLLQEQKEFMPNTVSAGCQGFERAEQLHASVSAFAGLQFGPLAIGTSLDSETFRRTYKSFLVCENFHKTRVLQAEKIDLTRPVPAQARYVITKIEFGHSAEYVAAATGAETEKSFRDSVDIGFAEWLQAGASGAEASGTASSDFEYRARLRGVAARETPGTPSGVMAKTPEEFGQAFIEAGPAVPIRVEYRRLPGDEEPATTPAPAPVSVNVVNLRLDSFKDGRSGKARWTLEAICRVNGREVSRTDVTDDETPLLDSRCRPANTYNVDGHPYAGPAGDPDFCRTDLRSKIGIEAHVGDVVECVYRGTVGAWTMPEATLTFTVGGGAFERNIGGYDEQVEYWLRVRVEE